MKFADQITYISARSLINLRRGKAENLPIKSLNLRMRTVLTCLQNCRSTDVTRVERVLEKS